MSDKCCDQILNSIEDKIKQDVKTEYSTIFLRDIDKLRSAIDSTNKKLENALKYNEKLKEVLKLALSTHGVTLTSNPPQDAWIFYGVENKARELNLY